MKKTNILEMALSRDEWRIQIVKPLLGGLGEWFKYRLAEKAGLSKDRKNGHLVAHWKKEATRLAGPDFAGVYLTSIKGGSREKAFEQALERQVYPAWRLTAAWSKRVVEADFGVKLKRIEVGPLDLEEFILLARETVDLLENAQEDS